jgi:hypothetical protein
VGRENEGKETHKLSSGGDSGESQAPLTAFGRERGNGKVGREIIEVGKMYRRRWAGKGGKGNTFNTSVWRSFLRNERQ